ncbi:LTA synthase family protein [Lactobacillus sp.]|uniref:LTA synthase family protein n=1 Tax=Lactobacillus sp. TaxID=1591 RepID=UPI003EF34987
MKKKNVLSKVQTRTGFLALLVLTYWLKYLFVAYCDFNLGLGDPLQHIIMWLSPFGFSIILLSLGFYFSKPLVSYLAMLGIDIANTGLLFANVLYYRQFADFITVKTMANFSKVSQGLGKSSAALLEPSDLLIWLDLIVIIFLLIFKVIKIDQRSYGFSRTFAITSFGFFVLGLNLMVAEFSRPRLLKNTFDRTYVVKYLGIDAFTAYDGIKNESSTTVTKNATSSELNKILDFVQKNYAKPNSQYYGKEKGKNVIVIHLESFQQFLINLKVNGKEVTPFLNSLYKNKHTLSYSNFYHQVGLGRTSDAENMLETSTYGISDGSLFTSLGSTNTFQAAPQILRNNGGYTSAVFHGNVGSFWNRNDVYKNMGYNYFFDKNYFSQGDSDSSGYGLKDKLLFSESIKYLEKMQQPFYVKYITVTNHTPFELDEEDQDSDFKTSNTSDKTINNYFLTAHYLDQSLKEFFAYLKKSGLYQKSMIVIYGDHYGLSNDEYTTLAPLIGKDPSDWSSFNTAQMQKVPFMIHASNLKGAIKDTLAGEIDVLPTLLHLLGINNSQYVQFGTDILSSEHKQIVVFRNGTVITPTYTLIGGKTTKGNVYNSKTGEALTSLTAKQKEAVTKISLYAKQSLALSDTLNSKNLLRYYTPKGFTPVTPSFDYSNNYQQMMDMIASLGNESTALYSQKGSTTRLYKTDAKELVGRQSEITKVPESVLNASTSSSSGSSSSSASSSSSSSASSASSSKKSSKQ